MKKVVGILGLLLCFGAKAEAQVCEVKMFGIETIQVSVDTDLTTLLLAVFDNGEHWLSILETKDFEKEGALLPARSYGRPPRFGLAKDGTFYLEMTEDGYWGTYPLHCRD